MPVSSSFRASDEDRERVVTVLREQTLAGRLTSAELDERAGLAYAAKTWGELRKLLQDLPVTLHFRGEPVPEPTSGRRLVPTPSCPPHLVPIVLIGVAVMLLGERMIFLMPLLVLGLVVAVIVHTVRRARRF